MRPGGVGWAIVLSGLPWSYFFIRLLRPFEHLDIWHANALWMQVGTLVMVGIHASEQRVLGHLPSALWWLTCWATGSLLWVFTTQMQPGQPYQAAMLLGVANLWLILLALLSLTALTKGEVESIQQAVFWSGVGLICYGGLQVVNLDQFFKWPDGTRLTDSLVGTIGNTTHFACQLALWLPIALIQPMNRRFWVIPALGLIVWSSSATAALVAFLLLVGWVWRRSKRVALLGGLSLGLAGAGWSLSHPMWLNPYGRLQTWQAWWDVILQRPILGWGLGFTKQLAGQLPSTHPLWGWKHLHNEYLQVWVELGAVGLALLGWAGWQLWQRRRVGRVNEMRWACATSLLACCLMATLSFPWHLWQLGGWGLFALSGWLVSTQEV